MEFTVKKANGEGPAPLLAFTLTEGENIWMHFKHCSVYKHKQSKKPDAECGGMCLLKSLS